MPSAAAWGDYIRSAINVGGHARHNARSSDFYTPAGAPPPPSLVEAIKQYRAGAAPDYEERTADAGNGAPPPPDFVAALLAARRGSGSA